MKTTDDDVFSVQDGLPSLARGNIQFDWVNLEEGRDGDYDGADPDDVNLLRFDGYRRIEDRWEAVPDSSYRTLMPATTPESVLRAALKRIMDDTGAEIARCGKAKRACERLSWMKPSDFASRARPD